MSDEREWFNQRGGLRDYVPELPPGRAIIWVHDAVMVGKSYDWLGDPALPVAISYQSQYLIPLLPWKLRLIEDHPGGEYALYVREDAQP